MEDNEVNQMIVSAMLTNLGLTVTTRETVLMQSSCTARTTSICCSWTVRCRAWTVTRHHGGSGRSKHKLPSAHADNCRDRSCADWRPGGVPEGRNGRLLEQAGIRETNGRCFDPVAVG